MLKGTWVAIILAASGCAVTAPPAGPDSGPWPSSSSAVTVEPTFAVEARVLCVGGTLKVRTTGNQANQVTCWIFGDRPPRPELGPNDEPYAVKVGEAVGAAARNASFDIDISQYMGPTTVTGGQLVMEPGRTYSVKVTTDGRPGSTETGFSIAGTDACSASAAPSPKGVLTVTPTSPCLRGALTLHGHGYQGKHAVVVLEGKNTSQRFHGFHPYIQVGTVELGQGGSFELSWTVPDGAQERIPSFFSPDRIQADQVYRFTVYDQDGTRRVSQDQEFSFSPCDR